MSKLTKINIAMIGFTSIIVILTVILACCNIIVGNYMAGFVWALAALMNYISGAKLIDTYFKTLEEEKQIKAIREEIELLNIILSASGKK